MTVLMVADVPGTVLYVFASYAARVPGEMEESEERDKLVDESRANDL